MGKELFHTIVDLTVIKIDFAELPSGKRLQHVVFDVKMRLEGDDQLVQIPSVTVTQESLPVLEQTGFIDSSKSFISPTLFCNLFPYHILFDDTLRIKQCGVTIQKMSHNQVQSGKTVHA